MRRVAAIIVGLAGLGLAAGAAAQPRRVALLRGRAPREVGGYTIMASHPTDPDVLLVGTARGFVMRTADGGLTWERIALLPSEEPPLAPGAPSVEPGLPEPEGPEHEDVPGYDPPDDPDDPTDALMHPDTEGHSIEDLTFCDTEPSTAFATSYDGVFRSHDGGETWEPLRTIGTLTGSLWVECDETDASHVVVSTDEGAWESLDRGDTWRIVRAFAHMPVNYAYPDGPNRIVVATSLGIYSGTPPADIETPVYTDRPMGDDSGDIGFFWYTDGPSIYVATSDGAAVTHDGGSHWSRVAEASLGRHVVQLIYVDGDDEQHAYFLASEREAELSDGPFDTSEGFLFETRDGGRTVEPIVGGATARALRGMALDPTDADRVWLLTDTALFLLDEPRTAGASPAIPLAARAVAALRRDLELATVTGAALRRSRLTGEDEAALRSDLAHAGWAPVLSLGIRLAIDVTDQRFTGIGPPRWEPEFRLRGDPSLTRFTWSGVLGTDALVWSDGGAPTRHGVTGVDFVAGITLTWTLDRTLVDERQVHSAWREMHRVRREMETVVADAWVERRTLLGELAMRDLGPARAERVALRVEELTALLDAITGGIYGGSLGERDRRQR